MEHEGSLPCSQEPTTGPFQLTPFHPVSLTSILILSSSPRLDRPSDLFRSDFPIKILYAQCVLHDHPYPP